MDICKTLPTAALVIQSNIAKLAVSWPFETNAGHSQNMITRCGSDVMYYKHLDMLPKKVILH